MSEIDVTGQAPEPQQQADRRGEYISGLRLIADFLAEHPEVQLPHLDSVQTGQMEDTLDIYLTGADQRSRLAAIAGAMGEVEHVADTDRVRVFRRFAGIALVAQASREQVPDVEALLAEPTADKPWFDADEPRVWRWENEADRVEPEGVTEVTDKEDGPWRRLPGGQWRLTCEKEECELPDRPWDRLLRIGPLTEVVPPAQGGTR